MSIAGTASRIDPASRLHPDTLRAIAATGVVRSFPRNTVLINEGDVGDALYVILSGRVKVLLEQRGRPRIRDRLPRRRANTSAR